MKAIKIKLMEQVKNMERVVKKENSGLSVNLPDMVELYDPNCKAKDLYEVSARLDGYRDKVIGKLHFEWWDEHSGFLQLWDEEADRRERERNQPEEEEPDDDEEEIEETGGNEDDGIQPDREPIGGRMAWINGGRSSVLDTIK